MPGSLRFPGSSSLPLVKLLLSSKLPGETLKLAVPLGTSTPRNNVPLSVPPSLMTVKLGVDVLLVTRVVEPLLHTVDPVQTMCRLAGSTKSAKAGTPLIKAIAIAAVNAKHAAYVLCIYLLNVVFTRY